MAVPSTSSTHPSPPDQTTASPLTQLTCSSLQSSNPQPSTSSTLNQSPNSPLNLPPSSIPANPLNNKPTTSSRSPLLRSSKLRPTFPECHPWTYLNHLNNPASNRPNPSLHLQWLTCRRTRRHRPAGMTLQRSNPTNDRSLNPKSPQWLPLLHHFREASQPTNPCKTTATRTRTATTCLASTYRREPHPVECRCPRSSSNQPNRQAYLIPQPWDNPSSSSHNRFPVL